MFRIKTNSWNDWWQTKSSLLLLWLCRYIDRFNSLVKIIEIYLYVNNKDDDLLYMDPHEVQPYIQNFVINMNDSSYHTNTMWKLKFSQLDPSVALVFYIFYL